MKFVKHLPTEQLKPYIKYFVVSESELENEYKIFPTSGLVIGFQYKGHLSTIKDNEEIKLASSGITGVSDGYKIFKNTANIGSILVYFTEIGFTHFTSHPANEIFNLCLSLQDIFDKENIQKVEENLIKVNTDTERIRIVEQFLCSQLRDVQIDNLILEAVKLIYQSKGTIRIKELSQNLLISQSPFEKRFRKVVGTSPKKFANIIRFNSILDSLDNTKTLTQICYENDFFDQAHFIKNFKKYTGETPENFKRFL